MPLFKEYDEQGNISGEKVEPLNEKNFSRFLDEYGEEKASVYLQAFAEFTDQMGDIIYVDRGHGLRGRTTSIRAFTKLKKLYAHNKLVLENVENLGLPKISKPNQL